MSETVFEILNDDIIFTIFAKLDDDPRHCARVACVSTRFFSLIRDFCWKTKSFPSLFSVLLSDDSPSGWFTLHKLSVCCPGLRHSGVLPTTITTTAAAAESQGERCSKNRKICFGYWKSHLATGNWNLSREQGSKLLARQFRDDCLYICDWPGCVHFEEKRKYNLFRGVFKNFKQTRVWRTINDGVGTERERSKIDLGCAFCHCTQIWDLHSAFCLRRGFGFHDDGEPVVRAYVCENGHVSGAWTDVPMYS
ncbi:hypothetical protein TanjilG_24649 [Lupinus angustifolius]|uniref:F-box domain-containing protein n=1 Tax=Lupinus angustifolius TaxID=3871 RepID=A0A4P1RK86_LUPAN|nr:PREDICTED: phytochrome A-associated F-box protein [Lupinus angustifolius]OIW12716.1 hypothetical protein TanjilG_24649 [Lupinus angustifolius]